MIYSYLPLLLNQYELDLRMMKYLDQICTWSQYSFNNNTILITEFFLHGLMYTKRMINQTYKNIEIILINGVQYIFQFIK